MNFGSVAVGDTTTQTNTISNPTNKTITIGKAITSGSYFQLASPSLPVTIQPGQQAQFVFRFAPNRPGQLRGSIAIWSSTRIPSSDSGGVENVSLRIPVWGLGAQGGSGQSSSLKASAPSIDFGSVAVGSASTQINYISNPTSSYITIGKAITTGSYFQVTSPLPIVIAPGQQAQVVFKFIPSRTGRLQGTITIWSARQSSENSRAGNQNPSLVIPVAGTGGESSSSGGGGTQTPGQLTVSSSSLSFGRVTVGSTVRQTATIRNSGSSNLTVKQASVSGTGFSVSPMGMPMTLAPNQSAAVSVSCAPKSSGALTGSLNISSDASDGDVSVPLSATAIGEGALTVSSSSLSFGSVAVNATKSMPETITNSGTSSVTLTQVVGGAGFTVSGLSLPAILSPGQSASFNVVFSPKSTGSSNVNLAIINDSDAPTFSIALSGSAAGGGAITTSPVAFGSVQVGSTVSETATITNSGDSSVNISLASLSNAAFKMSGLTTPLTLSAGQNFTFNVSFTPQAAGTANATISLVSTAATPNSSITLSGSGTAAGGLSVSPGSFAFGSVDVGSSKSLPVTLSATGASITVTSASVSSAEFTLTGPALPITIAAGSTASFSLAFKPQSGGAASASVMFATSASADPVTEAISGTGAASVAHSVELAWSASTSTITGYNVYRGSTTGGPYARINSSGNSGLNYTDTGVQGGQTYYYTTTAVSQNGTESAFSNEVRAVIPTP